MTIKQLDGDHQAQPKHHPGNSEMRSNVPKRPLETGDNPPATTAPEPTSKRSDPTAQERCPPTAAGDPAKTQPQPSPSRHPTQEEAEEGDPAMEDGSGPDPN